MNDPEVRKWNEKPLLVVYGKSFKNALRRAFSRIVGTIQLTRLLDHTLDHIRFY